MELWRDGLIAFLAAVGVAALFWMLAGGLLRLKRHTLHDAVLLLPLKEGEDDAPGKVRSLLQTQSMLDFAPRVVILDCGVDEETALWLYSLSGGNRSVRIYQKDNIESLTEELTK